MAAVSPEPPAGEHGHEHYKERAPGTAGNPIRVPPYKVTRLPDGCHAVGRRCSVVGRGVTVTLEDSVATVEDSVVHGNNVVVSGDGSYVDATNSPVIGKLRGNTVADPRFVYLPVRPCTVVCIGWDEDFDSGSWLDISRCTVNDMPADENQVLVFKFCDTDVQFNPQLTVYTTKEAEHSGRPAHIVKPIKENPGNVAQRSGVGGKARASQGPYARHGPYTLKGAAKPQPM